MFTVLNDEEMEEREYFSIAIENQSPDVMTVFEGEDELMVRILDDDCECRRCSRGVERVASHPSLPYFCACIV